MEIEDAELVVQWRRGDAAAAAALLQRHRARMRAVAVARLGPGHDAEDAVQEAICVALTQIGSLRAPAAAGAWLCGITRNVCRAVRRSERPVEEVEQVTARIADPVELLERVWALDRVWQAVNALTPPLRHALVLRHFGPATSYDAIAGMLGIPVGTVRSRLAEARRILASSLDALAERSTASRPAIEGERGALLSQIYGEYNRGRDCVTLREVLAPTVELRVAGMGTVQRGRDAVTRLIESDVEVGVRLRVLDVSVGEDIHAVVDAQFLNPPDAPGHCPPRTTQVLLHDHSGLIKSMSLHYPATGET